MKDQVVPEFKCTAYGSPPKCPGHAHSLVQGGSVLFSSDTKARAGAEKSRIQCAQGHPRTPTTAPLGTLPAAATCRSGSALRQRELRPRAVARGPSPFGGELARAGIGLVRCREQNSGAWSDSGVAPRFALRALTGKPFVSPRTVKKGKKQMVGQLLSAQRLRPPHLRPASHGPRGPFPASTRAPLHPACPRLGAAASPRPRDSTEAAAPGTPCRPRGGPEGQRAGLWHWGATHTSASSVRPPPHSRTPAEPALSVGMAGHYTAVYSVAPPSPDPPPGSVTSGSRKPQEALWSRTARGQKWAGTWGRSLRCSACGARSK